MNRESQSHFSNTPNLNISRSKFNRSFTHKTTFNTGDLIPIFCDTTIMPGDTVAMKMSEVVRMTTPITPVMDIANLDLYFFFVPYRLIWNHFNRFMGENDTAPWIQNVEYEIPQISFPVAKYAGTDTTSKGWHVGDLADYFAYPTEIGGPENTTEREKYHASALPFRAYCKVWNEFFRDENLQNPVNVEESIDSSVRGISSKQTHQNTYDPVVMTVRGAKPLKVAKYHDYFTSCLPGAQKGPQIIVPLGDKADVMIQNTNSPTAEKMGAKSINSRIYSVTNGEIDTENPKTTEGLYHNSVLTEGSSYYPISPYDLDLGAEQNYNIYADLSHATGATVNQLRQAFAIQKFYERQALGGSRYIEMVKSHFDVTNPDFRLQRPEYLGGKRIPINMNQVIQSTPTDGQSTPLGSTGAFSVTSDADDMFTHSFTEHGILLGLACVRTVHTYQQGLNRQYSKRKFTDFYFPEFANLGNQAVLNQEIFMADGENQSKNEEAFGYQEAWACERYFPDVVTGMMRSNVQQSLDIWHWADYYETLPSLGDKWIVEGEENVQRTLAVQDQPQFKADFYFGAVYTRPMPLYSIPGLIDHH